MDPDEEWKNVSKYYRVEFDEVNNLKRPLVDPVKRRMLTKLLKNDHLTIRSIGNQMLEKIAQR